MDELTDTNDLLRIEISTPEPSLAIVRLSGELDLSTVEELEHRVAPVLAEKPERLIIDASRLEFADSSAIALWLRWSAAVDHFEMRELSPLLRRILSAMGLEARLGLEP